MHRLKQIVFPQVDESMFAGSWCGSFAGLTYVRLDLNGTTAELSGSMGVGEIQVDERGVLENVTAAEAPVALANLHVTSGSLRFERRDGQETDHFELRLKGADAAELTLLLSEADCAAGRPVLKPFRLSRMSQGTPDGSTLRYVQQSPTPPPRQHPETVDLSFDKRVERILDKFLGAAVRSDMNGMPALYRWRLIPVPFFGNVVIHEFVGDDDLIPHLHPHAFISIGVRGRYIDVVTLDGQESERTWTSPWFRVVPAGTVHRVRLIESKPCWTIAIK